MISNTDILRVAQEQDIPPWLVQGIAADVGLSDAIRNERRGRFPRLETRRNKTAILAHLIEREEKEL